MANLSKIRFYNREQHRNDPNAVTLKGKKVIKNVIDKFLDIIIFLSTKNKVKE